MGIACSAPRCRAPLDRQAWGSSRWRGGGIQTIAKTSSEQFSAVVYGCSLSRYRAAGLGFHRIDGRLGLARLDRAVEPMFGTVSAGIAMAMGVPLGSFSLSA